MRRDVLAADLHEAVTELAMKQNASKHLIRSGALVVAQIESASPQINARAVRMSRHALPCKCFGSVLLPELQSE